jgi:hypothetical protein
MRVKPQLSPSDSSVLATDRLCSAGRRRPASLSIVPASSDGRPFSKANQHGAAYRRRQAPAPRERRAVRAKGLDPAPVGPNISDLDGPYGPVRTSAGRGVAWSPYQACRTRTDARTAGARHTSFSWQIADRSLLSSFAPHGSPTTSRRPHPATRAGSLAGPRTSWSAGVGAPTPQPRPSPGTGRTESYLSRCAPASRHRRDR